MSTLKEIMYEFRCNRRTARSLLHAFQMLRKANRRARDIRGGEYVRLF